MTHSAKRKKQIAQFAERQHQRFLERMEPFSEQIQKFYLEEFIGPPEMEEILNFKVSCDQIRRYLMYLGVYQGVGSAHLKKIQKRRRLSRINVQQLLYDAFLKEQKAEGKAWLKVCWSKHREARLWRMRNWYHNHANDPNYKESMKQRSRKYYLENKEKKKEQARRWKMKNPKRLAELRAAEYQRNKQKKLSDNQELGK